MVSLRPKKTKKVLKKGRFVTEGEIAEAQPGLLRNVKNNFKRVVRFFKPGKRLPTPGKGRSMSAGFGGRVPHGNAMSVEHVTPDGKTVGRRATLREEFKETIKSDRLGEFTRATQALREAGIDVSLRIVPELVDIAHMHPWEREPKLAQFGLWRPLAEKAVNALLEAGFR
jgi:hypothetical protein